MSQEGTNERGFAHERPLNELEASDNAHLAHPEVRSTRAEDAVGERLIGERPEAFCRLEFGRV